MNTTWWTGIRSDMTDAEKRDAVIAELADKASFFAYSAICAVYFFIQSTRWGTAETTAYFMRSAGMFGGLACTCDYVAKHLQKTDSGVKA